MVIIPHHIDFIDNFQSWFNDLANLVHFVCYSSLYMGNWVYVAVIS